MGVCVIGFHIKKGVDYGLVKKKEQEHVNDYVAWSKSISKRIEDDLERRYRTKSFSSVEHCKEATETSLQYLLEAEIKNAYKETVEKWDGEGKPHG